MGKTPQRNKTHRRIFLELGLVFVVFWTPLVFGAVYDWSLMVTAVVIFGLLAVYPSAVSKYRVLPIFVQRSFLAVFIFVLLQAFFVSVNRYTTCWELFRWVMAAGLFLLCQLLSRKAVLRLFAAIILMAFFESAYGLFEVYSGREMVWWQPKGLHAGYVTGTYFNRNHFSGFMQMALGIHLGMLLRTVHKGQVKTCLFFFLLMLVELVAFFKSGSRIGMAGFCVSEDTRGLLQ